jgi:hypothetical protein
LRFVAEHAVRIEPPYYRANSGGRMLSRCTPLGEQVLRESPERFGIPVERTVQRVGSGHRSGALVGGVLNDPIALDHVALDFEKVNTAHALALASDCGNDRGSLFVVLHFEHGEPIRVRVCSLKLANRRIA